MTPVQLWLPTFFGGIARPESRRDMQRMFKARTSERVMWSVPGWTGPKCWTQQGLGVSCSNGESLECVQILNVGASGVVVGPAAASFPNLSVNGLLDTWLNDAFVRGVPKNPDEKIHVMIPHPVDGGVAHRVVGLPIMSVHYFPFTHFNSNDKHVYSQWPANSDLPVTVSPEMESALPLSDLPKGSLRLRLVWLAPFDELQPIVISPDDLFARPNATNCRRKPRRLREGLQSSGDRSARMGLRGTGVREGGLAAADNSGGRRAKRVDRYRVPV